MGKINAAGAFLSALKRMDEAEEATLDGATIGPRYRLYEVVIDDPQMYQSYTINTMATCDLEARLFATAVACGMDMTVSRRPASAPYDVIAERWTTVREIPTSEGDAAVFDKGPAHKAASPPGTFRSLMHDSNPDHDCGNPNCTFVVDPAARWRARKATSPPA